ncbi:hypothetical protein [Dactylosporangium sp. NPDC005555]|uniref:hypothetical protein n=1 Tax=Dactylosporangium sp. NPDC005555 TaxID=3154889 RepID=UPI00339FAA92
MTVRPQGSVRPKLSVAVMTHPARLAAAQRLREQLSAADTTGATVTIACDPAPHEGKATLRSARLAWRQAGADVTHHLVVQDDVLVHPSFLAHVADSVARHPDHALSFFTEWASATAAAARIGALRGDSWVPALDHYVPTQALALPVAIARQVDAFFAPLPLTVPDDEAIHDLLARNGVPALVSVRNLVQHRDTPSIIGNSYLGLRPGVCYRSDLAESGVPDGPILDVPALLPYFSWWDRAAEFRLWNVPGQMEWHSRPITELLDAFGRNPAGPGATASAAIARLAAARPDDVPVPDTALSDLWAAAFILGLVAMTGTDGSIADALARPEAQVSLHTLAPGALRRLADAEELARWADPLADFVIDAVRAGAAVDLPKEFPEHYRSVHRSCTRCDVTAQFGQLALEALGAV